MKRRNTSNGFGMIEVVVLLFLIILAVGLLMPLLGSARRTARSMANNTQIRGIHQGLVNYAQSNKIAGNDGYFPGLDASGNVVPDGPLTGHSGDGTQPAARLWIMVDGKYFTPEYMIQPSDTRVVELTFSHQSTSAIAPVNFSYALQSIAGHPEERAEWSDTINPAAVVIGDRARGTGSSDISSVWTGLNSGDWRGWFVRNDNSGSFGSEYVLKDTKYGEKPANPTDHLFEDDLATADAFLVHEDATTAYSAD